MKYYKLKNWTLFLIISFSFSLFSGLFLKNVYDSYFNSFHKYTIEWNLSTIEWYVDDVLIQTVVRTSSSVLDDNWPFDKEFHLILNTAVGGTLGGPPNLANQSQFMLVDYVRVYQKISN